jgi:hypothetical protein
MIELEGLQPDQNVKQERKCFELACDQFGRTNAGKFLPDLRGVIHPVLTNLWVGNLCNF